jgi:hypothetical protein
MANRSSHISGYSPATGAHRPELNIAYEYPAASQLTGRTGRIPTGLADAQDRFGEHWFVSAASSGPKLQEIYFLEQHFGANRINIGMTDDLSTLTDTLLVSFITVKFPRAELVCRWRGCSLQSICSGRVL